MHCVMRALLQNQVIFWFLVQTGGVGSVAVAILAKRGYSVTALSGKAEQAEYLTGLGASAIKDRKEYEGKARILGGQDWAGAVDRSRFAYPCEYYCKHPIWRSSDRVWSRARYGLTKFCSAVHFAWRFFTRYRLSVYCPQERRQRAWNDLAEELDPTVIQQITHEIGLDDCIEAAQNIMAGSVTGRYLVKL